MAESQITAALALVPQTPEDLAAMLPKFSLDGLLSEMQRMERVMDADESAFDPEVILGIKAPTQPVSEEERALILAELRRKVDSIDYVIGEFESYAERTSKRAKLIAARAQAAKRRAERLEEYVLSVMQFHNFEMLPGDERMVEVRHSTNPALVVTREPTADDMLDMPAYVTEVPASYVWNAAAVKTAMVKDAAEFSFASLRYKPRLHFDERDKPAVADKKKRRKGAKA